MMYKKSWLLFLLPFWACQTNSEAPIENPNFNMKVLAPEVSGIAFANQLTDTPSLNIIEYLYYYNGGGVSVGDINNDGLDDLYFAANQLPDKLYLNLGGMKFKDISEAAGLNQEPSWSTGVSMQDVNNDGLLDIYVCKVGQFNNLQAHNELYLNNGNLTFTEVAANVQLDFSGFSTQAAFLDYDQDGDLDVYILNHNIHTVRSYGNTKARSIPDERAGDRFYENKLNETGVFEDVTNKAGIYSSALGYGLAVGISDFNNDGWPDIYVGNDFHENDYLYLNQGDKTFVEAIASATNHTSRFTMGVDIADMNNDGHLDFFTTDMLPYDPEILLKSGGEDPDQVVRIKERYGFRPQFARNHLQINKGDNTFSDLALQTQTFATDWSWGVLLADFDNDGWNDIFIPNGIVKRPNDLDYINYLSNTNFSQFEQTQKDQAREKIIQEMPTLEIPNLLIQNKGNLRFEAVEKSAVGTPGYTTGAAYSDLDNDGDLDLVLNNINAPAQILENNTNQNKGLTLLLKGDENNTNVLGTKLYFYANNQINAQEHQTVKGFQSSSSAKIHFGLAAKQSIDSLLIVWPNGTQQIVKDFPTQTLTLTLPKEGHVYAVEKEAREAFERSIFPYRHRENSYYDEDKEQLIPERLSQEGPAVLYADFNQDNIKDFFIGGASQQPAQILLGNPQGGFENVFVPDFERDRGFEDVAVASLDIDRDGDLDLYVGSGGNEVISPNPMYEDRIYVNDGKGIFRRAPISLPQTNTGCVAIADFDNDTNPDYFIGSRNITGAYGLTPKSFIVQNEAGRAMKILDRQQWGMITDAQWADLNQDGFLDLVLVGDWMPITVLINKAGKSFENQTKAYGLEQTQGLWNTLEIADFNQDGLLDIVAGNAGTNGKWQANPKQPIRLYLDDFDNNQQADPIIFYAYGKSYIPFATKNKLTAQLPGIKKRFPTYSTFSQVSNVETLLGKAEKEILQIKQIVELRSMLFLQQESGSFEGKPLPTEAQLSSIEDFSFNPTTGTLAFVGNSTSYVAELGPSLSNPGGLFTQFESGAQNFKGYKRFPLPLNTVAKEIVQLDGGNFVVITNNNDSYLLKPNE